MFERKIFINLKIYGKLAGLSNKFEPSMVFDPSEFEGPKFDLYICKMLISIFHGFFILYLKIWLNKFYIQNATEWTILCPSEKQFSGGGGVANPRSPTAFSLSMVGMYALHKTNQLSFANTNVEKYTWHITHPVIYT